MDQSTEIFVRGMVCSRCKSIVEKGISDLGYKVSSVNLGKLSMAHPIDSVSLLAIQNFLSSNGFEIISGRKSKLITQIKKIVAEMLSEPKKVRDSLKYSALLAENLSMNYDSISRIFTESEGITLEKYIIQKRMERVKELLVSTQLTVSEITHITGYGSINHLSRQFKEVTGLPPTQFRSCYQTSSISV